MNYIIDFNNLSDDYMLLDARNTGKNKLLFINFNAENFCIFYEKYEEILKKYNTIIIDLIILSGDYSRPLEQFESIKKIAKYDNVIINTLISRVGNFLYNLKINNLILDICNPSKGFIITDTNHGENIILAKSLKIPICYVSQLCLNKHYFKNVESIELIYKNIILYKHHENYDNIEIKKFHKRCYECYICNNINYKDYIHMLIKSFPNLTEIKVIRNDINPYYNSDKLLKMNIYDEIYNKDVINDIRDILK